jgi:hypothetical protein
MTAAGTDVSALCATAPAEAMADTRAADSVSSVSRGRKRVRRMVRKTIAIAASRRARPAMLEKPLEAADFEPPGH